MFFSKYDFSILRVRIALRRSGKAAFSHLGRDYTTMLGPLAEYIERHRDEGHALLGECTVCFDDGFYITLLCSGGVYYIIDAADMGIVISVSPIRMWKLVKIGIDLLPVYAVIGWRAVFVLRNW